MKFALYTSVAAAAFVAGSAAYAGNLAEPVQPPVVVQPAPMPAPVSDWSGFYVGGQLGTGQLHFEVEDDDDSDDIDYNTFGVSLGYMRDLGSVVVGGELSYDAVNIDNDDEDFIGEDIDAYRTEATLKVGYDAGSFLPYASVAYSNLSEDDEDIDEDGYALGLGVDYKITDSFFVGARYTHSIYEDVDDVDGIDLVTDDVSLRVGYQF